MAEYELYYGAEVFAGAMTAQQRSTLDGLLVAMGRDNNAPNPCRRLHRRVRTSDNLAALYQGVFEIPADFDVSAFKGTLATVFGVVAGNISHSIATPTFKARQSTVATFTYNAVQRFRVVLFGYTAGNIPTLAQSWDEAGTYLASNAAAWGEVAA